MKVAFVVVRYGVEILGGAEQACRMLAERLAAKPGWSVEVFTTCATDPVTWAEHLPPGTVDLNGVTVHRFRSVSGRDREFDRYSDRILPEPARASAAEVDRWLDLQGPVCPDAVEAAAASGADVTAFTPYLFWPTVRGIERMPGPTVLHPAAHDEPPIRLPVFAEVFGAASGLVWYTESERRLAQDLFPNVAVTPQLVLGLGIEPAQGDPSAFRDRYGLDGVPYLLCLGRVDDGKGARLLARFFSAYKRRRPGPLRLVMAGPVVHRPDPQPDLIVTGPLDEPTKWGALAGAELLVSPSPNESFSLVILEAWAAGVPVLVNGRCAATVEHVRRGHGGLAFSSYAEFETIVDRLLADSGVRTELAEAGDRYVEENFRWPVLIDRYSQFLIGVAEHGRD